MDYFERAQALREELLENRRYFHENVTVGQFTAGSAANIIPDTAVLKGTMRTNKKEAREKLVRRLKEVSEAAAAVYGGSAEVVFTCSVPTLVCDSTLTREVVSYMMELSIPKAVGYSGISASASEDFALIAERIPSALCICLPVIRTSVAIIPPTIQRCSSMRTFCLSVRHVLRTAPYVGWQSIRASLDIKNTDDTFLLRFSGAVSVFMTFYPSTSPRL